MSTRSIKLTVIGAGIAIVTVMALLPTRVTAQSQAQEVLDLILDHQALAMKVRPLQDRVLVASPPEQDSESFSPEGVPIRAKSDATTGENNTGAENRVSERLRHKNRAATSSDDYDRIKMRLAALEENARAERERINRPDFGISSARRASESGEVRIGDGRRGTRPAAGQVQQDNSRAGAAGNVDAKELADARKKLAALQRELATLEREVNALGRQ